MTSHSIFHSHEDAVSYRDSRPRHYTDADLTLLLASGKPVTLTLRKGDTCPNPVCPTCRIHGPAKIEFRRWLDGGIDAVMIEGDDGHAR